jgi:hypothetical protein
MLISINYSFYFGTIPKERCRNFPSYSPNPASPGQGEELKLPSHKEREVEIFYLIDDIVLRLNR